MLDRGRESCYAEKNRKRKAENKMQCIRKYGRIQLRAGAGCRTAAVTAPSGKREEAMVFLYQPGRLVYDEHGYEHDEPEGWAYPCFRYTPDETGEYTYEAGSEKGSFLVAESGEHGYVRVSADDPRYFAFTDGCSYVPIGPNLCILRYDALPAGQEHFAAGPRTECAGMISYRRWMKALHAAGANYIRLWLSTPYFEARTEVPGRHNTVVFNRLDAVMELAREYGMRVKLCLEHFRSFRDIGPVFTKKLRDPDTGEPLTDMTAWLNDPVWNARWLEDIRPYVARYQNDPVVFAWEAWNEMNCLDSDPGNVDAFGERMMRRVKAWSPKNMAGNSLGSYDDRAFLDRMQRYRDTDVYEYATVHRYLDQGAPMEICRSEPCLLASDGIRRMLRHDGRDKPVVMNETGAVNDRHTGPFRFYPCDHDGLLFHDLVYTPFFAGAAAPGHIWHWEHYLEPKNLWRCYSPLAEMLNGIDVCREHFTPETRHTDTAYIFVLRGEKHTLAYVRNRADSWKAVLRDGLDPAAAEGVKVPVTGRKATVRWLMNEERGSVLTGADGISLPPFTHGCILCVENG